MKPVITETAKAPLDLLDLINQLAPIVNGIWVVLGVVLGAVIVVAVWVTKFLWL